MWRGSGLAAAKKRARVLRLLPQFLPRVARRGRGTALRMTQASRRAGRDGPSSGIAATKLVVFEDLQNRKINTAAFTFSCGLARAAGGLGKNALNGKGRYIGYT